MFYAELGLSCEVHVTVQNLPQSEVNTLLCAGMPGFWTCGEPQEGREQCGVRWRYEQGGQTQREELRSQPGHGCEGRCVCVFVPIIIC